MAGRQADSRQTNPAGETLRRRLTLAIRLENIIINIPARVSITHSHTHSLPYSLAKIPSPPPSNPATP